MKLSQEKFIGIRRRTFDDPVEKLVVLPSLNGIEDYSFKANQYLDEVDVEMVPITDNQADFESYQSMLSEIDFELLTPDLVDRQNFIQYPGLLNSINAITPSIDWFDQQATYN